MQYDLVSSIGAVVREVRQLKHEGRPAQAVTASRTYATGIEDLWDAVTNIVRIPRGFAPVSGTLQLGGRYQIEGNASGTVTTGAPPNSFRPTWEFAGNESRVTAALTRADDEATHLEPEHLARIDPEWEATYGPGACGFGWDLSLLGLGQHIETGAALPPEARTQWLATDNYTDSVRASIEAWRLADVAAGKSPDDAKAAAANTAAFHTGETPPEGAA